MIIVYFEQPLSSVDLIDEIADHVDATNTRLLQQDRRIKKVTKKTGSCGE